LGDIGERVWYNLKKEKENLFMPIYQEIITHIENYIKNGVYPRGGAIPIEQELCDMFKCSRMTVRKALDELVTSGILYRRQGKGAFVSTIEYDRLYSLKGFTQIMREQGFESSSKVICFEKIQSDQKIAQNLRMMEGAEVYYLERIRMAMGEALSIEKVYLPVADLPNLLKYDFSKLSLYETLDQEYGIKIDRAVQSINTIDVSGDAAQILFKKDNGVVLRSISTGYDKNSKPIEYECALYNGYKYTIDVIISK